MSPSHHIDIIVPSTTHENKKKCSKKRETYQDFCGNPDTTLLCFIDEMRYTLLVIKNTI